MNKTQYLQVIKSDNYMEVLPYKCICFCKEPPNTFTFIIGIYILQWNKATRRIYIEPNRLSRTRNNQLSFVLPNFKFKNLKYSQNLKILQLRSLFPFK